MFDHFELTPVYRLLARFWNYFCRWRSCVYLRFWVWCHLGLHHSDLCICCPPCLRQRIWRNFLQRKTSGRGGRGGRSLRRSVRNLKNILHAVSFHKEPTNQLLGHPHGHTPMYLKKVILQFSIFIQLQFQSKYNISTIFNKPGYIDYRMSQAFAQGQKRRHLS